MSDGTNQLQFLDPASSAVTRTLEVYAGNEAVTNLNELEYIHGEIFANIWHSTRIARIDPRSGQVSGWIELAPLVAKEQHGGEDVLERHRLRRQDSSAYSSPARIGRTSSRSSWKANRASARRKSLQRHAENLRSLVVDEPLPLVERVGTLANHVRADMHQRAFLLQRPLFACFDQFRAGTRASVPFRHD